MVGKSGLKQVQVHTNSTCALFHVLMPYEDVNVPTQGNLNTHAHISPLNQILFMNVQCVWPLHMCARVCLCASPLSCHCNWRLSNRIAAARRRVYADAGAFDSPLTQGQPCVTDCSLELQRRREGKGGETEGVRRESVRARQQGDRWLKAGAETERKKKSKQEMWT